MDWRESLEIVIAQNKHEALRDKCSDSNTNVKEREKFRNMVVLMAQNQFISAPKIEYPPITEQIFNASKAAVRVLDKIVHGEKVLVDEAEQAKRWSICLACDHRDPVQEKCKACGCPLKKKIPLASEFCPLNRWLTKDKSAEGCSSCQSPKV